MYEKNYFGICENSHKPKSFFEKQTVSNYSDLYLFLLQGIVRSFKVMFVFLNKLFVISFGVQKHLKRTKYYCAC